MKLILFGAQASGKGTQATLISERFDIPHISTGDIFRENIRKLTPLGKLAQGYIKQGHLVPDDVTNKMLQKRLGEPDCCAGFILDGYPRNIAQAKFLDENINIDKAIEIKVGDSEAIKRISGRRTCEKCGMVYSIYQQKDSDIAGSCRKCGGSLIIREDDKEEAIKKRLKIYHDETEPVIQHYKRKGILLSINGEKAIEKISEEIMKKL
jgi:adenylate kinase